jgi:hypothetical protein
MKRLLAALLLAPGLAFSAIIATLENDGGGQIVLTDSHCDTVRDARIAYATSPRSSTLTGCWTIDEDFVHILWDDDRRIRSYEIHLWKVRTTPKKRGNT